jgi:hypothetical protein
MRFDALDDDRLGTGVEYMELDAAAVSVEIQPWTNFLLLGPSGPTSCRLTSPLVGDSALKVSEPINGSRPYC